MITVQNASERMTGETTTVYVTLADTIEQFEAWLNSKADGEIIGWARTSDNCPISNYLNATRQLSGRKYEVGLNITRIIHPDRGVEIAKIPRWMQLFVEAVDNGTEYCYGGSVTKEQALLTLKMVKANL